MDGKHETTHEQVSCCVVYSHPLQGCFSVVFRPIASLRASFDADSFLAVKRLRAGTTSVRQ